MRGRPGSRTEAERGEGLLAEVKAAFGVERQVAARIVAPVERAAGGWRIGVGIVEIVGVGALQLTAQIAVRPVGLQRDARFGRLEGAAATGPGGQAGIGRPTAILFDIRRQFEIADADADRIERFVVDDGLAPLRNLLRGDRRRGGTG
jgi:hypothetical protein